MSQGPKLWSVVLLTTYCIKMFLYCVQSNVDYVLKMCHVETTICVPKLCFIQMYLLLTTMLYLGRKDLILKKLYYGSLKVSHFVIWKN